MTTEARGEREVDTEPQGPALPSIYLWSPEGRDGDTRAAVKTFLGEINIYISGL